MCGLFFLCASPRKSKGVNWTESDSLDRQIYLALESGEVSTVLDILKEATNHRIGGYGYSAAPQLKWVFCQGNLPSFIPILNVAMRTCSLEVVQALIQAGAPINCQDLMGATPLDDAIYFHKRAIKKRSTEQRAGTYVQIINFLKEQGGITGEQLKVELKNKKYKDMRILMGSIPSVSSSDNSPSELNIEPTTLLKKLN